MNTSRLVESVMSCDAGIGVLEGPDCILMNPALQVISGLEPSGGMRPVRFQDIAGTRNGKDLIDVLHSVRGNGLKPVFRWDGTRHIGDISCRIYMETHMTESHTSVFLLVTKSPGSDGKTADRLFSAAELYRIIHDLKAPVRALKNLTGWISEECGNIHASEELLEYVELLGSSILELNDRIENLVRQTRQRRQGDDSL